MKYLKYMLLLLLSASVPCAAAPLNTHAAIFGPKTAYKLPKIRKVKPSPRLFASDTNSLISSLSSQYLQDLASKVQLDADLLVESEPITEKDGWSYLQRSRQIRGNISTLTGAWALTRDPKYRKAAFDYLGSLTNWNHISCEARSTSPPDKQFFFCLMYGEQAAQIGIMYDIFRKDMTPAEAGVFRAVLNRFHLKEALRAVDRPPWWANKEWSNWNGVCAGGMGILALAIYEDYPEAQALIPFVEESLSHYFRSFITNGGGCHEGTGYWNYGMTYAANYLLYWENATGKKHPAFEITEIGKSLHFPLDFKGLNFGDNDGWHPSGFFFELAKRMNEPAAAVKAAARLPRKVDLQPRKPSKFWRSAGPGMIYSASAIPSQEEAEAAMAAHTEKKIPVARVYDGIGWAIVADDEIVPSMRLAARGGSSEVRGHGMLDLMSFKCRLNDKPMITDQTDGYNAATFTGRGVDQFGRRSDSKSTLFVDGLGCARDVECRSTEIVKGDGLLGIRIDGSGIYMPHWRHRMFIGRLFLMVENSYWLVVDRVHSRDRADKHWVESRFITFGKHELDENSVLLDVEDQKMMMTFASLGQGVIQESKGLPIAPRKQATILRYMGTSSSHDNLHVTAMNPGETKLGIKIDRDDTSGSFTITITGENEYTRAVRLTSRLQLATE